MSLKLAGTAISPAPGRVPRNQPSSMPTPSPSSRKDQSPFRDLRSRVVVSCGRSIGVLRRSGFLGSSIEAVADRARQAVATCCLRGYRRVVPKAPTIYDVAAAAGVAPSTVSRAFSRPGRVNSATAQRIRDVATELGYRATPLARGLSTARTMTIALVISDITNPFYFEMIRGAQTAVAEAGYTMLLADTQESDRLERESIERALPSVEGIVLASSRMSDSAIRMMAKQKPLVVLNRAVVDVPSVVTDNSRGARRAAEHLGGLGHDVITYIAGPEASWADGMRWRVGCDGGRCARPSWSWR